MAQHAHPQACACQDGVLRIAIKSSPIWTLTVGFGFAPNLSPGARGSRTRHLRARHTYPYAHHTAGRELRPAPKVSDISMAHLFHQCKGLIRTSGLSVLVMLPCPQEKMREECGG